MLKSEGYRMFRGMATIVPANDRFKSFDVIGDWLYKPEWDCWYVNGYSYPADVVRDIREEQDAAMGVISEMRAKIEALSEMVVNAENVAEVAALVEKLRRECC